MNKGTGGATALTWTLANCGDDTNFKLTASSITGNGTIIPTITANAVQDLIGNNNSLSTSTDNSVTYDSISPTVSINQAITETVGSCSFTAVSDPTHTVGFSYRVSFSKAINSSTFTVADINNAGLGGLTNLTWTLTNCGDNTNFKLTAAAITGDGAIIPTIAANSVQDLAGNNNLTSIATDNIVTFDTIVPTVSINQAILETVGSCNFAATNDPTNAVGFSYRVAFSKIINPTSFTIADITNTGTGGGTALTWALTNCGDNTNFKLTASAIVGNGTIVPTLPPDAVQDLSAHNNLASTSTDNSVTYDASTLTVTVNQAILETVGSCHFTSTNDPSNAAGFSYRIAFSKAINTSSFTTADITNSGTGGATTLTWTLTNCGDNTNFKLTASSITGNGTIIPSIAANTVQDPAGNNNLVSTSTDNSVAYDSSLLGVTINQAILETVGSCSFAATSDPTNAVGFSYRVAFSNAINVGSFTTSDITNTGTGGGTTLTWTLTNCGDNTNFKLTASAITGNGTIIPTIAASAVQDLSAHNNLASTSTDNSVTYDSIQPTVTINQAIFETVGSCSFTAASDPSGNAGFSYRVIFSEAINPSSLTTADIVNAGTGGSTTLTWTLTNCGDNTNFKLTALAVVGNGTIRPTIAANAIQDLAGNNNLASTSVDNSVTYDSSLLGVTINQAITETVGSCSFASVSDPTNAAGFSYRILFSKAINTSSFTIADIVNTGTGGATTLTWTLTNCGDNTNFKLTATAITGNGTIIPTLSASAVQDLTGNNNSLSTSTDNSVTYDSISPTVSINQAITETVGSCHFTTVSDPTNTVGFSYRVFFSKAINTSTFTVADINNAGLGGLTNLTWTLTNCGDNTNFKLTAAAITGNGTIIPTIAANTIQDLAGNNNLTSTATDNTVTFDTILPTVTINQAILETVGSCSFAATNDPTGSAGFSYRMIFSKAINPTSLTTADIVNTGTGGGSALTWTITNCGDNTNFKLTASSVTGDGTIVPSIAANAVQDSTGNNNLASTATDNIVTFDTVVPTVTINQAILETVGSCSFASVSDPTNAAGFSYRIIFSKIINPSSFTTADITNSGTGGATALTWTLTNCGDNTNFKLTATAITGNGTIIPMIAANSVQDLSANNNSLSTSSDNSVTYDSISPTVSINQAIAETVGSCHFTTVNDPTNTVGFSYRVSFSKAINTSTFTVADITNAGLGGLTNLTWTLTNCGDNTNFKLTAAAITGDGTIIPTIAANTIQDLAGNNNLTSTSTDNIVTFDTLLPTVTINQAILETVGSCNFVATNDPTNAVGFSYRVAFSKVINPTSFTIADITNTGTGGGTALTWTLTSCGDNTNFKLTASSITGDGTIVPSITANVVQDSTGNNNLASTSIDNSVTYDSSLLGVTINQAILETVGSCSFIATNDPTNAVGFSYRVAFSKVINPTSFTTADITNRGTGGATTLTWTLTNCGDNTNFKLTASTIVGNGTIVPTLAADAVQDLSAHNNLASTSTDNSVAYDASTLTVTVNQAIQETVGSCNFTSTNDPSNAAGFSYRMIFSKAINTSSFTTSDITNSGTGGATTLTWTLTNCGDDTNFKLTASSITGNGTIRPGIAANSVQDPAGNNNLISTSTDNSVTYDNSLLGVTINQAILETVGSCIFAATSDPTNAVGFSYRVAFSNAINVGSFTTADITNTGTGGGTTLTWTLTNCGDNTNFKLTATAITGNGTIIPTIAASAVQDLSAHNNLASTSTDNSVTYDSTAPTVTINQAIAETVGSCSFTAASDPSNSAGFSYRVIFSEAINPSSFTTADIVNTGTGGGTTLNG